MRNTRPDDAVWEALLGTGVLNGVVQSYNEADQTITVQARVKRYGDEPTRDSKFSTARRDITIPVDSLWAIGVGRRPNGWHEPLQALPTPEQLDLHSIDVEGLKSPDQTWGAMYAFPGGNRELRHAIIGANPVWHVKDDGTAALIAYRDLRTVRLSYLRIIQLAMCLMRIELDDCRTPDHLPAFEDARAFVAELISLVEAEKYNRATSYADNRKLPRPHTNRLTVEQREIDDRLQNLASAAGQTMTSAIVPFESTFRTIVALMANAYQGGKAGIIGVETGLIRALERYFDAGDDMLRGRRHMWMKRELPAVIAQIRADAERSITEMVGGCRKA